MKDKHLYCVLCAIERMSWDAATPEEREGHKRPILRGAKFLWKNMSTCGEHFEGYMANARAAQERKIQVPGVTDEQLRGIIK